MRCRLVCHMRSSVGLASGSTISLSSHCYWIIYLFIYPNINSLGLNESNFNMALKHINTALLELGLVLEVVLVLDLGLMFQFMGRCWRRYYSLVADVGDVAGDGG